MTIPRAWSGLGAKLEGEARLWHFPLEVPTAVDYTLDLSYGLLPSLRAKPT